MPNLFTKGFWRCWELHIVQQWLYELTRDCRRSKMCLFSYVPSGWHQLMIQINNACWQWLEQSAKRFLQTILWKGTSTGRAVSKVEIFSVWWNNYTINSNVPRLKHCAQMLLYNEGQVLKLLQKTLPTIYCYLLFGTLYLIQEVKTAKCVMTNERLAGQNSTPYMSLKTNILLKSTKLSSLMNINCWTTELTG